MLISNCAGLTSLYFISLLIFLFQLNLERIVFIKNDLINSFSVSKKSVLKATILVYSINKISKISNMYDDY